jgi:hypothetical protein
VTLGRALFELGRLEEARAEFHRVLDAAPGHLIAVGKLAEIHQRTHQIHAHADRSPKASPGQNQSTARAIDQRVLVELEAWLQVISESRR